MVAVNYTEMQLSPEQFNVLIVSLGYAKGYCVKRAGKIYARRGDTRTYHAWLFKRDEYDWMLKRFRRQANGKQPPEVLGTWVDKNTKCV